MCRLVFVRVQMHSFAGPSNNPKAEGSICSCTHIVCKYFLVFTTLYTEHITSDPAPAATAIWTGAECRATHDAIDKTISTPVILRGLQ